ncbi:MAG: T9SS type A sorting domain-containing protein [Saprospiraceae bacterium]|nr:T9SS type A sorting domain-containing protein [Saprospiraceae bacterium]
MNMSLSKLIPVIALWVCMLSLPTASNAQDCNIFDAVATAQPCLQNGTFYVQIDFSVTNPGQEGYKIQGGGAFYGFYSYNDDPPLLGPFPGNGNTVYEFVIIDLLHPDCQDVAFAGPVSCSSGPDDDATCVAFESLQGSSFGGPAGTPPGTTILSDAGVNVNVVPFQTLDWTLLFGSLNVVEANPDFPASEGAMFCYEGINTSFNLTQFDGDIHHITVDYFGNLGPFNFSANGAWPLVLYTLSEGTYNIGPGVEMTIDPISPSQGTITFSGNLLSLLLGGTGLCLDNFCIHPQPVDCHIYDLVAEATPCNDQGQFYVHLNFQHQGTSGAFRVRINDDFIGLFSYDDLPLELGPFNGPTNQGWLIKVIDAENEDCRDVAEIGPVNCGNSCDLAGSVDNLTIGCDGNFYAIPNFNLDYSGVSDSFTVSTLGGFHATYAYADLPFTLGGLPVTNTNYDRLLICDQEHPDCCIEIEYDLPCQPEPCLITDLNATPLPCNDDGYYFVQLDFDYQNTGDFFRLRVDGQLYGEYSYDDLPITVGPFAGDGVHGHSFRVVNPNPECSDIVEIGPIECGDGNCNITNIVAEPHNCDGGQFLVDIAFDAFHPGELGYLVFANGIISGPYDYSLPFVTVGPFEGNGTDVIDILIIDMQNPTCYGYVEVGPIDCENQADCHIYDLVYDIIPCNAEGNFSVFLNFQYDNVGEHGFMVVGNGHNYGTFEYADLPITIGPLPGNGEVNYEFGVKDVDHPDCHDAVDVGPIDCTPGLVWPGDADNDNIARHFDLLRIGLANGTQGPPRNTQGVNWEGVPAANWDHFFEDDINFKYADCNGNGLINKADKEAIVVNYGETHGPVPPFEPTPASPADPPIFLNIPNVQFPNGAVLEAPVVIGTVDIPVEALYGVAFTIEYNPQVIDPTTITINYPDNSWLGIHNENLISIHKHYPGEGLVEIALTRLNHENAGGHGPVAMFRGVIDDIAGMTEVELQITKIRALRANESAVALYAPITPLSILAGTEDPGMIDLMRSLKVYPNPTTDEVVIYNKYMLPIEEIAVLDAKGQDTGLSVSNNNRISLASLQAGVYILRLQIGDHVLHQRVVKM